MSVELPSQVVWLLNVIGVDWPNVDEDEVRAFASHVRTFATGIENTHQAASSTIDRMRSSYQGASYEQLVEAWAHKSTTHLRELTDACGVVATALDVAAEAIVTAKGFAVGELVALAASFVADQAAAVVTFGLAEAAEAGIIAAAKLVVRNLEQQLVQHIMGEVIGQAVQPLEGVIERAVGQLAFEAVDAALGARAGSGGRPGSGLMVIPGEVMGHAAAVQGHADDVASHAATFSQALAGLRFDG